MDEITIGDKMYISSKRAAKITGYAKDYVGQLCREGRVEARLVGRNWYVLEDAIREHRFGVPAAESKAPASTVDEPISNVSAWERPQYVPEAPAFMAELSARAVPSLEIPVYTGPSDEKVLTEMQKAWQEWFTTRPAALPDGHEMLDPTLLPTTVAADVLEVEPEIVPEAPATSTTSNFPSQQDIDALREKNDSVNISRISAPSLVQQAAPLAPEHLTETLEAGSEAVSLHRTNDVHTPGLEAPAVLRTPASRRSPETRQQRESPAVATASKAPTQIVLKAVVISLAGLAIVVAVIGSGVVDSRLPRNPLSDRVINFLEGTSQYSNTK